METLGTGGRTVRRLEGRGTRGPLVALLAPAFLTLLTLLALLPTGAGAAVLYPPIAGSANETASGFELTGTVYNYGGAGADTTYHFDYGTTSSYGSSVPMPDADAGSGLATPVSQQIGNLQANTTYHWRLVSTNSVEGTGFSSDHTFSTAAMGAAPPTSPPPGEGGSGTGGGAYPGEAAGPPAPTVGGKGPRRVARRVESRGRALLAARNGHTLYSLSVERRGHFVCTAMSGCTSLWHPLTVAAGVVPKGPVKLGTVRRPEGSLQVTYRGHPLYAFGGDKKPRQTKGDGFKDVGTWHPVVLTSKGAR
jgi:predicted lipoprotein with Yx(FWY)xxD motif